jgi:hypothetical protein
VCLLVDTPEDHEKTQKVTERDVYNNYRSLKNNPSATTAALDVLVQAGIGKWQPVPTTPKGGTPTREFHLFEHPQTAEPNEVTTEKAQSH